MMSAVYKSGAVVAAAIVVFAWATTPPTPAAEAPEFRTPVEASVHLTGPDQERLGESLGDSCVKSPVQAIVLSVSEKKYSLISEPTDECKLARFTVGTGKPGGVQPVESVKVPAKEQ